MFHPNLYTKQISDRILGLHRFLADGKDARPYLCSQRPGCDWTTVMLASPEQIRQFELYGVPVEEPVKP